MGTRSAPNLQVYVRSDEVEIEAPENGERLGLTKRG